MLPAHCLMLRRIGLNFRAIEAHGAEFENTQFMSNREYLDKKSLKL
jgi:hypothetical protein